MSDSHARQHRPQINPLGQHWRFERNRKRFADGCGKPKNTSVPFEACLFRKGMEMLAIFWRNCAKNGRPIIEWSLAACLGIMLFTPSLYGQVVEGDRYYSIIDGALTLNGSYEQLQGVEALSQGGYLDLDTIELPGGDLINSTAPFADGVALPFTPQQVIIGVLGRDKRIDIYGHDDHGHHVFRV